MKYENRPKAALAQVPAVAAADGNTAQANQDHMQSLVLDRPRPVAERAATATDLIALLEDPHVQRLVAYVGAESRELGYRQAEQDMADAWCAAAHAVQRRLRLPTHEELVKRRAS